MVEDISHLLEGLEKESTNYKLLIEKISSLIHHDFNQLIQILYRVDVSESKLRTALRKNTDKDAAVVITDLIVERLKQKETYVFNQQNDIPEEDRW